MIDNTKVALKAAENALQDAIERQSQIQSQYQHDISQIVHDLKNPLSAMMGYLALMKNEVSGPIENKTYAQYIKTLDSSAHRMLGLCHMLLEQYVGETSGDKPEETPQKTVNVTAIVDEVHDLFAAQAIEREIELSTSIDGQMPELGADPQDIYRALTNLVSNAIKFTPKGGKVDIQGEVDAKDNTFIMVVRDSGVGMTQEQIQKIKDHSEMSTVSPHGDIGTGQGLGIVSRIVSSLGGQLDIVSTENRGTRIKLKFPKKIAIKRNRF